MSVEPELNAFLPLLATAGLFACMGNGHAADAPVAPAKPKAASASATKRPAYALAPLEAWTEELGPAYRGHQCKSIAKKLHSFKVAKGEFETTAAHAERIAGLSRETLVGTTLVGDTLAFVDEYGFLSTDYDADRGTLRVRGAWGFKQQRIGESFFVADLLDSTRRSSRSYAGANAYGRTVQVTSTTYSACGLLFKNIPLKLLEANVRQLDESLELPAEEARRAKQNIKRVYVGKLAPPYLSDYFDFTRPSIKDRQEQDWDGDNLTIELQQVWLINQQTGRVYKKIDI